MNIRTLKNHAADWAFSNWHTSHDPDPEAVRFQTLRDLKRAFPLETPRRRELAVNAGMRALSRG